MGEGVGGDEGVGRKELGGGCESVVGASNRIEFEQEYPGLFRDGSRLSATGVPILCPETNPRVGLRRLSLVFPDVPTLTRSPHPSSFRGLLV